MEIDLVLHLDFRKADPPALEKGGFRETARLGSASAAMPARWLCGMEVPS